MENHENQDNSSMQSESHANTQKPFKETFRTGSPEEVRDKVKDTVAKGVAAVAGALRGFTETTKNEDIAGRTKEAIGTAGQTASSTISSVADQAKSLKEPLKEAGQKLSETAKDLRQTAKEQYSSTKEAVGGAGGSSSGSMGASSLATSSYNQGASAGSGSVSGSGTGAGLGEMPDISSTPLAASDKELKNKDLTEDLDS